MDLATLQIKVDASGATRSTDGLTRAFKQNTEQAVQAELGVRRIAAAHREAVRDAARMTAAARDAAREMTRQQSAVAAAEQGLRRIAAAEREAYREAEKLAAAQRKVATETEKTATGTRGLSTAMAGLGAIISVAALTRLATQFVTAADSAKLLEGRLKLVTTGSANLAAIEDKLFASAQRTRLGYEATVTLYARVARNAAELGRSQADLLRFTELVQMATQASGATAQEAAAGMIQLAQAMASGQLRGEELRSVMENMAGVSRALAQGLGVPIGELRKMAEAGELTANKVVDAILKMDAAIRGDFKNVPETAAGGWTRFTNALGLWVKEADKAEDTTGKLSRVFSFLADNIERSARALNAGTPERQAAEQAAAQAAAFERRFPGVLAQAAEARAAREASDAAAEAERNRQKAITDARNARRAEWEESRALAAERKGWEDAEVIRLGKIEAAARKVLAARLGVDSPSSVSTGDGRGIFRPLGPFGGVSIDGVRRGVPGTNAARAEDNERRVAVIRQQMEEAARTAEQIAKNFLENVQGSLGSFFTDIFTNGTKSFANLWDSFKRLALDAIGQIAAKNVIGAIFGGAGGAAGGLLGGLSGGTLGLLAGAGILLGGIFGGRRRPRTPASQTPSYPSGENAERARQALAGANGFDAARENAVQQSVGGILTQSSASEIVANLRSIRLGIVQLVQLAQQGAMGGSQVTVNGVGGGADAAGVGAQAAAALDRLLGGTQQRLRLQAGTATLG